MISGFEGILKSLSDRDLITPYLESAILSNTWPASYPIEVDSRPYYGLNEDGTPDGYFHPSTHATMDERKLYYRFHPDTRDLMIPERRTLQTELGFAMGSALHAVLQTQMTMIGLVSEDNIEKEYVNHEHHVRGRIDWVVDHPNGSKVVTEFKTRNSRSFTFQKEPEESWVAQLNLAMDSQDEDQGVLLMMESGYPYRMCEFRVRRDRELLDKIYSKFDRVREAIANNEPPRHCCPPDSKKMEACFAKWQCWLKEESVKH